MDFNSILGDTIVEKTRRILGWTDSDGPKVCEATISGWSKVAPRNADDYSLRKRSCVNDEHFPSGPVKSARYFGANAPVGKAELTPPPSPAVSPSCAARQQLGPVPCANLMECNIYAEACAKMPDTSRAYSPMSPPQVDQLDHIGLSRLRSASDIFDMLTKREPNLSKERNRLRTLVQMVSSVLELETQLNQLKVETEKVNGLLNIHREWQLTTNEPVECTLHPPTPDYRLPSFSQPSSEEKSDHFDTSSADVPEDLVEIDLSAFQSLIKAKQNETHNHRRSSVPSVAQRGWHGANEQWSTANDAYYADTVNSGIASLVNTNGITYNITPTAGVTGYH